jgi:hypothetical protein
MATNSDYDYLNAILAGYGPDSTTGHWPTRVGSGPNKGLILKLINHESLLQGLLEEGKEGYNFWHKTPDDRLYTYDKLGDILSKRFAEKTYGE